MNALIEEKVAALVELQQKVLMHEEDLELTQRVVPEGSQIWLDSDINVGFLAKSIDEIKQLLRAFAKAGVMLKSFNNGSTNPAWFLQGKHSLIYLTPYWLQAGTEEEGVTCRLVQDGTRTVPSYKLVCSQGSLAEVGEEGGESA